VICVTGNSSYWTGADEFANVYGAILPDELAGLRFKCPPHPVLKGPRSWSYACNDLLEAYRKRACDRTEELKDALTRVIQFSAGRFARDKEDYRFVDKSQTATVRVGLYQSVLARHNPKFVLVGREPYVSVLRAAMGKAGDMRKYKEKGVLNRAQRIRICSEHLGNSIRSVFQDAEELGINIHITRFEDLLLRPEQTVRAACDFLNLEFNPDMLPREEHRLPLGSRFLNRWYPLRTSVNEQYEKMLGDEVIECVNQHCEDVIPRLGYPVRLAIKTQRA
jgi:hypothetical protein